MAVVTFYCKPSGCCINFHLVQTPPLTEIPKTKVGYIVWAPISSLIVTRTRPSLYFPTIMLLWGVVTCAISAVKTYPQLLVMRVLVGALESGFTPGMMFLFSCWYLPSEFGKRSALFLTSAQIGGIFGGLAAGAIMADLEGAHGIRGWRWLFIVEGVVTIGVAIVAVFVLPDFPGSSKNLTATEKKIALGRLGRVGTLTMKNRVRGLASVKGAVVGALKDWKTYALGLGSSVRLISSILCHSPVRPR
jgi:MFS family permease